MLIIYAAFFSTVRFCPVFWCYLRTVARLQSDKMSALCDPPQRDCGNRAQVAPEGSTNMAHNLDETTGRAAIAFRGSRDDVWHRMGQEMPAGQSVDQWLIAASLDWQALTLQSYFNADDF